MHEILQLLFPSQCLICKHPGIDLCSSCDLKIARHLQVRYVDGFPTIAAAYYGEELSKLILLAKEQNNQAARRFLAKLLCESFDRVPVSRSGSHLIALVPIPSSSRANRKRGYRHGLLLAREAARQLGGSKAKRVVAVELLRVDRPIADQSTLDRQQRAVNISGAYSLSPKATRQMEELWGADIYLIDDLTTSGSSIREGLRALNSAGFAPQAALLTGVST